MTISMVFPIEIWTKILQELDKQHLKQISLVCKTLQLLTSKLLWAAPTLKRQLEPDELQSLNHLPIQKLHSYDLALNSSKENAEKIANILKEMPKLEELTLCRNPTNYLNTMISLEVLRILSPFVTSISTDALIFSSCSELINQLLSMDFPSLKSLTIVVDRRRLMSMEMPRYIFQVKDLKALKDFPITKVYMSCFIPNLSLCA